MFFFFFYSEESAMRKEEMCVVSSYRFWYASRAFSEFRANKISFRSFFFFFYANGKIIAPWVTTSRRTTCTKTREKRFSFLSSNFVHIIIKNVDKLYPFLLVRVIIIIIIIHTPRHSYCDCQTLYLLLSASVVDGLVLASVSSTSPVVIVDSMLIFDLFSNALNIERIACIAVSLHTSFMSEPE